MICISDEQDYRDEENLLSEQMDEALMNQQQYLVQSLFGHSLLSTLSNM